jgi:hypothetical protein
MAEVKSSLPALALRGSPEEVIIKNPAITIKINAVPPPTPSAQGRTKARKSVCEETVIQPIAVLIPNCPVFTHLDSSGFLSTIERSPLKQQEYPSGQLISL